METDGDDNAKRRPFTEKVSICQNRRHRNKIVGRNFYPRPVKEIEKILHFYSPNEI